ncbi:50S ribosomal protein L23 [Patescibacteria group bacterium]|nr:50S ribosomal protein L23 [Patescibacteria group bacterium]MBU1016428.1 50S ribosomal protein L23 [Patescibacteria group bacterium]MBU1684926.1 50S ribosomal protein L23 [Patescibacteria group bacterium]MBU1939046.1 50S ribosomal protein L23 [Patescibacteria group bacterium]
MQLTNVLIAPVVTEKSSSAQAKSKYTVRVKANATKVEIAKAVNKAYGVDVISVNIIPVREKKRVVGRGRAITKRPASKKAIITIKAKQNIDFNKLKIAK